eukprot:645997-Prorocentrum_minimum.AAC.3
MYNNAPDMGTKLARWSLVGVAECRPLLAQASRDMYILRVDGVHQMKSIEQGRVACHATNMETTNNP